MKKLNQVFIILISITAILGCERVKYDPYESAKKAILGRWEIVELGNWPVMTPSTADGYVEYLSNDTVRMFEYDKSQYTFQSKYWIDSLLHMSLTRDDGLKLIFDYRYEFYDNKLRLDSKSFMTFSTFIYTRLN